MKSVVLIIAGALAGFFTAAVAISERASSSAEPQPGAWRDIANGADDALDPYLRARYASVSWLLPAQGEDQILETGTDSAGSALDGDCRYVLAGQLPAVRWWQIAIASDDQAGSTDPRARPDALTSERVIGESDGHYRLTVWRSAASGNWISPASGDNFRLVLTLHRDGPVAAGDIVPPEITRVSCD